MKQALKTRGTAVLSVCTENLCPIVRVAGEARMTEDISHKMLMLFRIFLSLSTLAPKISFLLVFAV